MSCEISYIKGDLIKYANYAEVDALLHLTNCFCVRGSGVAKAVFTNMPEAYVVDQQSGKGDVGKLGNYTVAEKVRRDGKNFFIFNAYGQYEYGVDKQYVDYSALRSALKRVANDHKNLRFVLPYIGTGTGGGRWTVISGIIKETLCKTAAAVYVVEYVPDITYLLVAGSRSYRDVDTVAFICDYWAKRTPTAIVTGRAKNGPDDFAYQWAKNTEGQLPLCLPAIWKKDGKVDMSAGYKRNVEMGDIATRGIIFYNEFTNGTKHMEKYLSSKNIPIQNYGHKTCPKCKEKKHFSEFRTHPDDHDARFTDLSLVSMDSICKDCEGTS